VLLIPTYGPVGAAGASLAAQALNLALTSRLAYRTLQASFLSAANVVRITCAAAIMAIAVWWLNINTIPRITLGVVIYGMIILILKTPFVYETIRRVLKTA
jgi:peptidoglycan biosynthesis protein MviN/MurJ (putative lipid II flippase)